MTRHTLSGPPMPRRGEERFFNRRQADDACAWTLAGGIAIRFEQRPLTKRKQREVDQVRAVTVTPAEVADWTSRTGRAAERCDG
jgi:hypothetical protein